MPRRCVTRWTKFDSIEEFRGRFRGGAIALLMYHEVRKVEEPREVVLEFLESCRSL